MEQRDGTFSPPGGRGPRFKDRTRSQLSLIGRAISTTLLTLMVLGLTAWTVVSILPQLRTWNYVRAEGAIVQTRVVPVSHRTLGKVHETRVRASYVVKGVDLITNTLHAKTLYWFRSGHAEQVAARYREGSVRSVWHSPTEPTDAVIDKRVFLEHGWMVLLLVPALVLLLGRVAGGILHTLRSKWDPTGTGVHVDTEQDSLRVTMPIEDAARFGRRMAFLAAVVAMLAAGLWSLAMPATITMLTIVLLTVLCLAEGLLAGIIRARRGEASGRHLLFVPKDRQVVVRGIGRDGQEIDQTVPAGEVEAIVIEDTWRHPWRWDQRIIRRKNELVHDNPSVVLRLRSGGTIPVAIWHHPRTAPKFGRWLCTAIAAVDRGEMPGTAKAVEPSDD